MTPLFGKYQVIKKNNSVYREHIRKSSVLGKYL